MRIPLLRGREFTDADRPDGRLVLIISETAAEKFFPGEDPIGKRIDWGDLDEDDEHHNWREIVGVVADVRRRGLAQKIAAESYAPLTQHPTTWLALAVRTQRPEAVLAALPAIVQAVDPEQAVSSTRPMVDRVADSLQSQRYVVVLLGAFAITALLLATIGIFGLVAYSTAQRTREIGIRMALGSTPQAVVGLVMKGGARLVGAGVGAGLVCALLVGRILASKVPGVGAFDLAVYAGIPAVLAVTGLIACLVPAWRAVRVPPAIALRYE
jgi:predicted permease